MQTSIRAADSQCSIRVFSILTLVCLTLGCAATDAVAESNLDSVRSVQPEDAHSPADVVQLQLTALGLNRELGDDDGIRIAFRFASPSNKVATGPVDKFIGILQNPTYRPMLEFESVEFAETRTRGEEVGVLVKLTMDTGEQAGYVFVLSKQGGDPCDCWMTDRVMRVDLQNNTGSSGKTIGS